MEEEEAISHSRVGRSVSRTESNASRSGDTVKPWRIFQVIKSSAWGLGTPQGIFFDIVLVDSIHGIEGQQLSSEIVYHTSRLVWWKQRLHLPPPFQVYSGSEPASRDLSVSKSDPQVAVVKYKGLEGMFGMRCEVSMRDEATSLSFENQIVVERKTEQVMIRRSGVGRTYAVSVGPAGQQFVWQGSKKVLDMVDDDSPRCNGNLKLFRHEQPERVIAVWKNRTDPSILGSVMILEDLGDDTFLLEMILWSCLSIVLAERETGRGWLGGVGR